jgi:hypothetical protein
MKIANVRYLTSTRSHLCTKCAKEIQNKTSYVRAFDRESLKVIRFHLTCFEKLRECEKS